jgi:hypothetical protein
MKTLIGTLMLGAVFALGFSTTQVWAQDADPLNGTWHLNAGKSKFLSGPAITNQTRTYEVSGQSVKQSIEGLDSQGNPVHQGFTAQYDGKDYPVTGNPDADTISVKRIDRYRAKSVMKKGGKVIQTTMRSVSHNGKILTMKNKGKNAKGEKVENVLIFEKQ